MDINEHCREIASLTLRDYESRRLPYALHLNRLVDAGDVLDADESGFLDDMLSDIENATGASADHPDLGRLRDCVTRLHRDIQARSARNGGAEAQSGAH
jgi:hypothetical protein